MIFDIHDDPESDQERFVLGRSGSNKLFTVGVNPSTADKCNADQTIIRVGEFSKRLGLHGFVMFNIYPQRATNPKCLRPKPDSELVKRNVEAVRSQLQDENPLQIWAAWGNSICRRNYLWDCLSTIAKELDQFHPVWRHCGKPTQLGHPRHPLFLADRLACDESFYEFNIFEYLDKKRIIVK